MRQAKVRQNTRSQRDASKLRALICRVFGYDFPSSHAQSLNSMPYASFLAGTCGSSPRAACGWTRHGHDTGHYGGRCACDCAAVAHARPEGPPHLEHWLAPACNALDPSLAWLVRTTLGSNLTCDARGAGCWQCSAVVDSWSSCYCDLSRGPAILQKNPTSCPSLTLSKLSSLPSHRALTPHSPPTRYGNHGFEERNL